MKRFLLYVLITLSCAHSFAQSKPEALGTKTLYQAQQSKYTAIPSGFKAVYVNYIGRHGARHLTKDIRISSAYKAISKADSLHALSADGLKLKTRLLQLNKVEEKHVASISLSGAEELEGIAKRLFQNHKEVFADPNSSLLVATTNKGRTKESAEAFLNGLKALDPALRDRIKFNYADDDHLRFYDFSKTYDVFKEEGNWKTAYNQLAKANKLEEIAAAFCKMFFNPAFLKDWKAEDEIAFTEDIYGFYTIIPAVQQEIKIAGLTNQDVDLKSFFNSNSLAALKIMGDAEDFLTKGPGVNARGIQVRIAAPLLADFIHTTDLYLKSKPVVADLRFAHAETVAPFAALLGIKGASEATKNIFTFYKNWQAEQVIPFSSNIQWILFQDKNGRSLIKFLLNEREVAIDGIKTNSFPYYDWNKVRAFYVDRLKSMGLTTSSNMHQYLLNVK